MPKPVSFLHSGTVGAPVDRVFALLTDPKRLPDWLPGCRTVAPKEQLMRVGARYHLEMGNRGVRVEIEIVDYQPPRAFGWVEHLRRAGNKTFIKLDYQGGATRVTIKHVWHPQSFRSWLLGQFYRRRDARRMFNGTIQNLRKALLK
ncbi:MAG TPA: SRPBCC family protein [Gemmatimonadales bacterium]|nr:SRPBCC family protein [Gemmatimonadales bacterium]